MQFVTEIISLCFPLNILEYDTNWLAQYKDNVTWVENRVIMPAAGSPSGVAVIEVFFV